MENNYSEPIRKLEELEKRISDPPKRKVSFPIGDGSNPIPVWTLDHSPGKYSVVKSFVTRGSAFPLHRHEQKEFIIVTDGIARVTVVDSGPIILSPGDGMTIEKDQDHTFEAIESCWVIAVLIPDSNVFAK